VTDLDRRTRTDADRIAHDARALVDEVLPHLLEGDNAALAARGAAVLGLSPVTITVEDRTVTLDPANGALRLRSDDDAPGAIRCTPYGLSRQLTDQTSAPVLQLEGEIVVERGPIDLWVAWEPVVQALLNGRAVYEPGSLELLDRGGTPLDARRVFTPDDDPSEIGHFLGVAGFLHLRGFVSGDRLRDLEASVDDALASARPGEPDVATNLDTEGNEVVVGIGGLPVDHDELAFLATIVPGTTFTVPTTGNVQHKQPGIASGFANTPWHRDCGPGGHSYKCCVQRVGIALTKDDAGTGRFGAVAGTHRVNVSANPAALPAELQKVDVECEPGDVHVHLSCTFHRGTPPTTSVRRVLYSDFLLPGLDRAVLKERTAYKGNGDYGRSVGDAVASSAT
jgi:hypothetical protein